MFPRRLLPTVLLLAFSCSSICPLVPAASPAISATDGWTTWTPRPEIAPKAWIERQGGKPLLALAGCGDRSVDGCWRKTLPVAGGQTYRFAAAYRPRNVELERRSIAARVVWLDANGKRVEQPDYPPTVTGKDSPGRTPDWRRMESYCAAPQKAAQAQLELIFRWDADGQVLWDTVEFQPAERPRRLVRLATIYCRPRGTKSAEESVEKFAALVRKAADSKPDFICLPEGITVIGNGKKYVEVAEPVPGPTTQRLGELARQSHAYIIAGIYEREGKTVYNTAVLIGRDGRFIGRYRKASLPREEIEGGITPGDSFPVFDTDFGKVGMMICWDVFFAEPARALARGGAEIIFMPIWGGNADLIKARPIENQVYLVASSYDAKTAIYDRTGTILAEATEPQPIALAEIDLAQPTLWPWLGNFRDRIPREGPVIQGTLP